MKNGDTIDSDYEDSIRILIWRHPISMIAISNSIANENQRRMEPSSKRFSESQSR